jgi:Domain of unknown function (DUF4166)
MVPKFKFETEVRREEFGDLRFRKLLARDEWKMLPFAVKARFSKRLAGGATAVYTGLVTDVRISKAGRALAHALRLIGAPLPIFDHVGVPTIVTVTEDVKSSGQIWTRLYGNRAGFPQVIHSAKRFSGPTGLEEYIGFGVAMALTVTASPVGLVFESAAYSIGVGAFRLKLPHWLTPGSLTVTHSEVGQDRFVFTMTLRHPVLGELIHQAAEYRDSAE